jgi:quercetin dioxygenase-like cupin family protein
MNFRNLPETLLAAVCACQGPASPDRPGGPLDVSRLTEQAENFHGKAVHARGLVASVCREEGCFIDLVPSAGKGEGVLVSPRHEAFSFPNDSVGKIAVVKGTFYGKVYPLSRLDKWHGQGWRDGEKKMPPFAQVFRIEADSVTFEEAAGRVEIEESPLAAFSSPLIDLGRMEFEAAGMGTGRKCLEPGESMPEHSTGPYHELLFGIEGELNVRMHGRPGDIKLAPGQAFYVPPGTEHGLSNKGSGKACYIFVYSMPEAAEEAEGQ